MRNCLYNGQATQFLKKEAETEIFKEVTGNSLKPKTMRDRECINRFCAFYLLPLYNDKNEQNYKGDMDEWLAEALRKMNKLTNKELENLSNCFQNTLQNNYSLFGNRAFRKHTPEQNWRGFLNVALWDVMTVGLANYSNEQVKLHAEEIKKGFYGILNDKNFNDSITLGTNSSRSVNYRFKAIQNMFQEVFNA